MIRKFTIAPARYRWIRLPPSHRPPVFCRGKLGLRIRLGMACMREAGALLRTQFGRLQMLLLLQAEGKFPHIVGAVDSCSAVWGRGVLQLSAACFTHLRTARLHVRMLPGEDVAMIPVKELPVLSSLGGFLLHVPQKTRFSLLYTCKECCT